MNPGRRFLPRASWAVAPAISTFYTTRSLMDWQEMDESGEPSEEETPPTPYEVSAGAASLGTGLWQWARGLIEICPSVSADLTDALESMISIKFPTFKDCLACKGPERRCLTSDKRSGNPPIEPVVSYTVCIFLAAFQMPVTNPIISSLRAWYHQPPPPRAPRRPKHVCDKYNGLMSRVNWKVSRFTGLRHLGWRINTLHGISA
jgi:hypothetical protein